jgi:hypothetical protein
MTSDSTTRWPLLEERAPFATATRPRPRRRQARSLWLLMGLAFVCGGLVSAAAFSIGWRHQAQRDTAAQSALAAATARTHRLEQKVGALQASLATSRNATTQARTAAASAAGAEQALARTGAKVGTDAESSRRAATTISSGAGTLTAVATRVAGELKTLDTYLTTTPTGQLDPGYISSQTGYLSQQLTRLQADADNLDTSITSFESALRTLGREARTLKSR